MTDREIASLITNELKNIIKYDKDPDVIWDYPRIVNYLLDFAPSQLLHIKRIDSAFNQKAMDFVRKATLAPDNADDLLRRAFDILDDSGLKQSAACAVIESYVGLFPNLASAFDRSIRWNFDSKDSLEIDSYKAKMSYYLFEQNWDKVIEEAKKATVKFTNDSQLYFTALMAKLHINDESMFTRLYTDFGEDDYYKKAYFFADNDRKIILDSYLKKVKENIETKRLEKLAEEERKRKEAQRLAQIEAERAAEAERKKRQAEIEAEKQKQQKLTELFARKRQSNHRNKIAVSVGHQVFIGSDNKLYAQGSSYREGQQNVTSWKDIYQIAAGNLHTVGIKCTNGDLSTGGKVVSVGSNRYKQREVGSWKNIKYVACGDYYTVGLDIFGKVFVAGSIFKKASGYKEWRDIESIYCGPDYFIGIDKSGVLHLESASSTNFNISGITNVEYASCGKWHIAFLLSDGSVVCVGSNTYGECKTDAWRFAVSVAAGDNYTYCIDIDGNTYFAGYKKSWIKTSNITGVKSEFDEVFAIHDSAFFLKK